MARVELISSIGLTPELLGIHLPGTLQAFHARLDKNQGVLDNHFIVCAYFPPLDRDTFELIAGCLLRSVVNSPVGFDMKDLDSQSVSSLEWPVAGGIISFITEDAKGRATVISGLGQDAASPFDVAATVAIIKANCGWDESNPILVTVNEMEFAVHAQFDGSGWLANWSD